MSPTKNNTGPQASSHMLFLSFFTMIVESPVLWGMEYFLIRVFGLLIYLSFPVGIKNIQGCIRALKQSGQELGLYPASCKITRSLEWSEIFHRSGIWYLLSSYTEISEWSTVNTHWPLAPSTVMEQQWRRAWVMSWCFPWKCAPFKLFSQLFLLSQWVCFLSATTRTEGKWESEGETAEDWNSLDVFRAFFCIPWKCH